VAHFILNKTGTSVWTPEHGVLLKSLRLRAGLDLDTLARRNILSKAHVRQLEEGGGSAFYSADIKFAMGKKLLKQLGHEIPTAPWVAEQAAVFSEPVPVPVPLFDPVPETVPVHVEVASHAADPNPSLSGSDISTSSRSFAWPFLMGLMALTGFWMWFNSGESALPQIANPSSPATQVQSEQKPEPVPSAAETKPEVNIEVKSEAPTDTMSKQVLLDKGPCVWQATELEVQPPAPRKPGEYVHVVASKAATVCIMDAQQRVATLTLSAGEARSIYGQGPFKVYSAALQDMAVFFQGVPVKIPSADVKQLNLTATPLQ